MAQPVTRYISTTHRHLRYIIFVDSTISEKTLRRIMQGNLGIWGGRYNPIVPVTDNHIPIEWVNLAMHFDPDYVFYSNKIDALYIKSLNLFQPIDYVEFNEETLSFDLPGINIHYLLHYQLEGSLNQKLPSLLNHTGNWNTPLPFKEFYELNAGLQRVSIEESKWQSKYQTINIDEKKTSNDIGKLIYEGQPYFKSLLSAQHVTSVQLATRDAFTRDRFLWIVYSQDNYLQDLLFFWNRQLYIEPLNRLQQVISSIEELEQLSADPYFEGLCYRLCFGHQIYLASISLTEESLRDIQVEIQPKCNSIQFITQAQVPFPFSIVNAQYINSNFHKESTALVLDKEDFLRFPPLSFEDTTHINRGEYCIDLVIERDTRDKQKEVKFPYGTPLYHLVCRQKARINRNHRISILLQGNSGGIDFKVPDDTDIISTVLSYRQYQKDLHKTPIEYINISNAGQKLSAFYHLFDEDWLNIQQYIEEKFWLQLFRYESDLKQSGIPKGKGIFSYHDIQNEITGLFDKYRPAIKEKIKRDPEIVFDEAWLQRYIERNTQDAYKYHINPGLKYLVEKGGLFIGMRVSCKQCGSNKWYSLAELSHRIGCKGCNNQIIPNIDSKVYYRLSDILVNNLLNDQTTNGKEFDGNYIVLKALLHLKYRYNGFKNSFIWSPCLEFTTKNNWQTDLDIVAILNGTLILGEAKSSAGEFSKKVINGLVWIANNLNPDKIMIACNTGNLAPVAAKIKAGLTNGNCEVIQYVASKPWYHFSGLFGLPTSIPSGED